ncbi:hypothetical protein EDB89DRAFT_1916190 [Lactarius sanguifluus]|nr:hypothetical protein EDB89DRAFT_1916190 [Lactarius sanguifluus]
MGCYPGPLQFLYYMTMTFRVVQSKNGDNARYHVQRECGTTTNALIDALWHPNLDTTACPPPSQRHKVATGLTLAGVPVSQANELLSASYQLYWHSETNDTVVRTVTSVSDLVERIVLRPPQAPTGRGSCADFSDHPQTKLATRKKREEVWRPSAVVFNRRVTPTVKAVTKSGCRPDSRRKVQIKEESIARWHRDETGERRRHGTKRNGIWDFALDKRQRTGDDWPVERGDKVKGTSRGSDDEKARYDNGGDANKVW